MVAGIFTLLFVALPARAASFNPTTFVAATNDTLANLVALVGLGTDLQTFEGATWYSTTLGVDIGFSARAVAVPGKSMAALSNVGASGVPHYIPIPKINIQKGLFDRVMVGTEFIPSMDIRGYHISAYGFDVQWFAIDRPRVPAISFRTQFNYSEFAFIRTATYGADALTSYQILFFHIYGGAGYRFVHGNVSNPTPTLPSIPGVNFSPNIDAGHFVAGLSLMAAFLRVTSEANITTQGVNTYGAKLSVFF